ncbi:hypothetical protein RQP46_010663 [Phenoliferia psychrophenolica]
MGQHRTISDLPPDVFARILALTRPAPPFQSVAETKQSKAYNALSFTGKTGELPWTVLSLVPNITRLTVRFPDSFGLASLSDPLPKLLLSHLSVRLSSSTPPPLFLSSIIDSSLPTLTSFELSGPYDDSFTRNPKPFDVSGFVDLFTVFGPTLSHLTIRDDPTDSILPLIRLCANLTSLTISDNPLLSLRRISTSLPFPPTLRRLTIQIQDSIDWSEVDTPSEVHIPGKRRNDGPQIIYGPSTTLRVATRQQLGGWGRLDAMDGDQNPSVPVLTTFSLGGMDSMWSWRARLYVNFQDHFRFQSREKLPQKADWKFHEIQCNSLSQSDSRNDLDALARPERHIIGHILEGYLKSRQTDFITAAFAALNLHSADASLIRTHVFVVHLVSLPAEHIAANALFLVRAWVMSLTELVSRDNPTTRISQYCTLDGLNTIGGLSIEAEGISKFPIVFIAHHPCVEKDDSCILPKAIARRIMLEDEMSPQLWVAQNDPDWEKSLRARLNTSTTGVGNAMSELDAMRRDLGGLDDFSDDE